MTDKPNDAQNTATHSNGQFASDNKDDKTVLPALITIHASGEATACISPSWTINQVDPHGPSTSKPSGYTTPDAPSISPLSERAPTPEAMDIDDSLFSRREVAEQPPRSIPIGGAMDLDPSSPLQPTTSTCPPKSTPSSYPSICPSFGGPNQAPRLNSTANITATQLSPEDTALLATVKRLRTALWQHIQLSLWTRFGGFYATVTDCYTFYAESLTLASMPIWQQDAFVPANLVPEPGSYEDARDEDRWSAARLHGKAGGLRALREMRGGERFYNGLPQLLKIYIEAVQSCWEGVAKRVGRPGELVEVRKRWEELTNDQRPTAAAPERDIAVNLAEQAERKEDMDENGNGSVIGPSLADQAGSGIAARRQKGKGKQKM